MVGNNYAYQVSLVCTKESGVTVAFPALAKVPCREAPILALLGVEPEMAEHWRTDPCQLRHPDHPTECITDNLEMLCMLGSPYEASTMIQRCQLPPAGVGPGDAVLHGEPQLKHEYPSNSSTLDAGKV